MNNNDMSENLRLSEAPTEDVREVIERFLARSQLLSTDNCTPEVIDQRAMRTSLC